MKNLFFGCIILAVALLSCRGDEVTGKKIDQVLNIYIDSAGVDMLNSKLPHTYQSISMNDDNGDRSTAPVTLNLKYDKDSIRYIEYVAGAKRIGIDSTNMQAKVYESDITITFTTNKSTTVTSTFQDHLKLQYVLKPELFSIQKAWYNNNLVFTKKDDVVNVVKVTK